MKKVAISPVCFLKGAIRNYKVSEVGSAAMEAALVLPILVFLLLGTLDLGYAIMSNQKTIKSSQVVADLVTRYITVTDGDVNEAIEAGRLSLQPYSTTSLGFDVISFRFLNDGTPEIVWRETVNMAPLSNPENNVEAIAEPGRGVVMVVSQYRYEPIIINSVVDSIDMQEIAFARGRRSEIVCQVGALGCS